MGNADLAMPMSLQKLLSARRRRQNRTVTVMVSLAVAFAVASSFLTTAAVAASARDFSGRVIPGDTLGSDLARSAARQASLPSVGMSALTLCISGVAISCVLAVAFIGRKRSLGILKVLGVATADLYRLFALETLYLGGIGIPAGLLLGLGATASFMGPGAATPACYLISASFGLAALGLGVYLPLRLVKNGTCYQLLNNRPVYATKNPSCAKCGLCGGF